MYKKKLLTAILVGFIKFTFAQAPAIDWQYEYWAPTNPGTGLTQTQNQSGEDWFYYHKSSLDANLEQNGSICAGYSNFVNYYGPETADGCYDRPVGTSYNCNDFESPGNKKGNVLSAMSLLDINGSTVWFKLCLEGWFYKVIQTSDGGYVGVGPTRATQDLSGNPLYYNPNQTSGHVTDAFTVSGGSCTHGGASGNKRKIQLVKLDRNGNLVWQYIYGMVAYSGNGSTAYNNTAQGFCLAETPEGHLIIGGFALDPNNSNTERECLIETDANGYFRWASFYGPTSGVPNTNIITGIARTGSGANTKYAIAGEEVPGYPTTDSKGFVFMIDNASPPNIVWSVHHYGAIAGKNVRVSDVDFNIAGEIILPAGINCSQCSAASEGIANGKVYRIDASNGNEIGTAADLGTLKAYDFKIGITHTQDGGYAVVSAAQPNSFPCAPPTNITNTYCSNPSPPTPWNYDTNFWGTDAYVAKGNASNVIEWSATYDATTLKQALPCSTWVFPDPQMRDLKSQECLYSISQDADGGFTFAGNTSSNFDDNYLVKLHTVCTNNFGLTNAGVTTVQNYAVTGTISTAPNYVITPTGNVTFQAGNSINLTDGFGAKSGSTFHAYIDPSLDCTPNYKIKTNESPDNLYLNSSSVSNSKFDDSSKKKLTINNGIILTIFPNPNTGVFNLAIESKQLPEETKSKAVISICNTLGKEIYYKDNVDVISGISTLDISSFSSGVYFVKVIINNTIIVKPMILRQ